MNYKVNGSDLTSVADAIRTKGGTSASLSFPDGFVSAVQNIPTGGGSTLITKTITANGTYDAEDDSADGYSEVTVNVPNRIVIGTFTPQSAEKGTVKTISVQYEGTGYPIALIVFPSVGAYKSGSDFYTKVQRYGINTYFAVKSDQGNAPTYSGNTEINQVEIRSIYKASDSDATSYSTSGSMTFQLYRSGNPSAGPADVVSINSSTEIRVFVANTSYGFISGIEYTYQIVYSS